MLTLVLPPYDAIVRFADQANTTCEVILDTLELKDKIPFHKTWRLNERHYGGLTGLNKAETAEKYGDDQVRAGPLRPV